MMLREVGRKLSICLRSGVTEQRVEVTAEAVLLDTQTALDSVTLDSI